MKRKNGESNILRFSMSLFQSPHGFSSFIAQPAA